MTDVLLHIGLMKTGSSWLQQRLFLSDCHGYQSLLSRAEVSQELVAVPDVIYDNRLLAEKVERRMEEAVSLGRVPVVSQERLGGDPISGGRDSVLLCNRLKGLFPDAKVLIFVREQADFLYSYYNEFVNGGGSTSLKNFLNPVLDDSVGLFHPSCLEYHRIVSLYRKVFGPDKVVVECYEMFCESPLSSVARINSIVGLPSPGYMELNRIRRSKSPSVVSLERHLNRFLGRSGRNPAAPLAKTFYHRWLYKVPRCSTCLFDGLIDRKRRLYIEGWVGDRYRNSNALLQNYIDVDLRRLGYKMG